MAAKQHQHQQHQQPQQHMGSSRFMGLSQEYPPLATAASFSSASNKKWVLNSKNDVVELGVGGGDGSSFHHQENPTAPPHPPPHFLESAAPGFLGDGRLMRYNSAPSCLFSDLDQIARSLNESPTPVPHQLFAGADQQQLPPLPVIIEKRNHNHPSHLELKKKNGGPGQASSSRFSTAQSSVVSLGMDFDQPEHNHCSNGFTGLLTGSSTTTTTTTNTNNLLKGSPSAGGSLARQSSSPASLLSRLEIEHGTGTTGSSEEDSPLMRSPINDQDHEQPGGMGSDCGFWDGNAGNVAAAVAAVQHAHHVAAAAQVALHQQHQHQQQQQQQQQPMHGVFLSNGNSTGENRKRIRDVDMDIVEAAAMDHHNQQQQQQQHTLTRHLSLPISSRSSSGLLAAENLLQDSVPCRLRAKRGCATHPRSIAERVRRTRISERMRRLQELVPNMDKQTNMSDMLDEAAEYMKFLQKKVEELEDCREKCQGLCKMSQSGASNHLS